MGLGLKGIDCAMKVVKNGYIDDNGTVWYHKSGPKRKRGSLMSCRLCGTEYVSKDNTVANGLCSLSCSGKQSAHRLVSGSGDDNPNWRGGRSSDPYNSYVAEYKRSNPEKAAAHNKVRRAIMAGTLKRMPCEVCGKEKSEAHHDDYLNVFDVRWLCRKHHTLHHARETGKWPNGGVFSEPTA